MKVKKYQKGNYLLWLVINYDPYGLRPDIDEPLKLIEDFDPDYQDREELKDYYVTTYAITDETQDICYEFDDRKEAKEFLNKLVEIENPPRNYELIREDVRFAKAFMEHQLSWGQSLKNDDCTSREDWENVLDTTDSTRILKVLNWLLREYE